MFRVSCLGIWRSDNIWILEKLKFDYLKNKESFRSEIKNIKCKVKTLTFTFTFTSTLMYTFTKEQCQENNVCYWPDHPPLLMNISTLWMFNNKTLLWNRINYILLKCKIKILKTYPYMWFVTCHTISCLIFTWVKITGLINNEPFLNWYSNRLWQKNITKKCAKSL